MLNKEHFPSMFNLATCYEIMGRFSQAKKWFRILLNLKPKMIMEAYMGCCLVCIKLGHYEEANDLVTVGLKLLHERQKYLKVNKLGSKDPVDQRSTSTHINARIHDYKYI